MKETIKVNNIFNFSWENLLNNKIDENLLKKTIVLAHAERAKLNEYECNLFTNKSSYSYLFNRSIELINSINNFNSNEKNDNKNDILKKRKNLNITSNIQKQIFINNFIFPNNEQFIHSLKINNINIENIEYLNNVIIEKKKQAKIYKNYELNISFINIDSICNYFNFNNQAIMINKILELYNLEYDILKEKLSQKMR